MKTNRTPILPEFDEKVREIFKKMGLEVILITNRYGGFGFNMGEPHVCAKNETGEYSLAEVYCGLEDSPHPLSDPKETESNFVRTCFKGMRFSDKETLMQEIISNKVDLINTLDWDELCDVNDFLNGVLEYLKGE